ncbi:MAG: GNAT family N-acetyltransferase [Sediminibacterium sp.]|nr:GNAT family N-acetyltransferase [Sediminibacterium sp.]
MISFEPVNINEVYILSKISKITFNDTYGLYNTVENMRLFIDQKYNIPKLEQEILTPELRYFFLKNESELIGYCRLNFAAYQSRFKDTKSIQIERFYILPQYKNKGWGRILMENIKNWVEKKSIEYIWLGVWRKNQSAIAFYNKMGFYKFAEEVFMLGTDPQDDDIMRYDLIK